MKMNAMMLFKEKDIRLIEKDIPQISYNEVLIKNSYAGLCGTDLHIYDGEFPAKFPLIMGH